MASRGIRIAPKSRILNAIPLTGHELLPFPGSFVRAAQYIRGLAPLTSFRGKSIDQRLGCCWISLLPSKISSDLRTKQIYFPARKMTVWKSVQCSALDAIFIVPTTRGRRSRELLLHFSPPSCALLVFNYFRQFLFFSPSLSFFFLLFTVNRLSHLWEGISLPPWIRFASCSWYCVIRIKIFFYLEMFWSFLFLKFFEYINIEIK